MSVERVAEPNRIAFVCTDRGQHDRIEIAYSPAERPRIVKAFASNGVRDAVHRGAGPLYERKRKRDRDNRDWKDESIDEMMQMLVMSLCCTECGRNPQRNAFQLMQEIEAFDVAGFTEVDISHLPY